jgi:hypothetical protein
MAKTWHGMPSVHRFVNDREADAFLTRDYRKPFVVPDEV